MKPGVGASTIAINLAAYITAVNPLGIVIISTDSGSYDWLRSVTSLRKLNIKDVLSIVDIPRTNQDIGLIECAPGQLDEQILNRFELLSNQTPLVFDLNMDSAKPYLNLASHVFWVTTPETVDPSAIMDLGTRTHTDFRKDFIVLNRFKLGKSELLPEFLHASMRRRTVVIPEQADVSDAGKGKRIYVREAVRSEWLRALQELFDKCV